jgi:hypothetical protein
VSSPVTQFASGRDGSLGASSWAKGITIALEVFPTRNNSALTTACPVYCDASAGADSARVLTDVLTVTSAEMPYFSDVVVRKIKFNNTFVSQSSVTSSGSFLLVTEGGVRSTFVGDMLFRSVQVAHTQLKIFAISCLEVHLPSAAR